MIRRDRAPNLFLRTRSLAKGAEENHLTEFIVAALNTSPSFRAAYADVALRRYAVASGWPPPEIVRAEPQVGYRGWGSPDMRLRLSDGRVVLSEHKIDSAETVSEAAAEAGSMAAEDALDPEEIDVQRQLWRYLNARDVDAVMYIRASWKRPEERVLAHPKYIRPEAGGRLLEHFLWRDIHKALQDADEDSPLIGWLREGFGALGYTPPHPVIGELEPRDETTKPRRGNFAKFWTPTRALAGELGWEVGAASQCDLVLLKDQDPEALATRISLSPSVAGRFRIRVTPGEGRLSEVAALLERLLPTMSPEPSMERLEVRARGPTTRIDLYSTLPLVLGDASDVTTIEERLVGYVRPVLEALSARQ